MKPKTPEQLVRALVVAVKQLSMEERVVNRRTFTDDKLHYAKKKVTQAQDALFAALNATKVPEGYRLMPIDPGPRILWAVAERMPLDFNVAMAEARDYQRRRRGMCPYKTELELAVSQYRIILEAGAAYKLHSKCDRCGYEVEGVVGGTCAECKEAMSAWGEQKCKGCTHYKIKVVDGLCIPCTDKAVSHG